LLPAGMKITTYNDHLKAPSFPALRLQTKNTVSDGAFALIQSALPPGFGGGWGIKALDCTLS